MEFLPKEIIQLEILPWLPAKPLTRFKCVSKEWYSLINGIAFINLHHKRTLESPTFDDMILVIPHRLDVRFYTQFDSVPQTRDNGIVLNGGPAEVVGFCNGLICLKLERGGRFGLYDPLTNKTTDYGLIPRLDDTLYTHKVSQEYGFGYDDVGHVYKIVSIRRYIQAQEWALVANIFSTGTRYWEVVNDFPSSCTYVYCPGVYINNKLHWIVNNQTDNEYDRIIITLDLHAQVFGEMSFPKNNEYLYKGFDLMVMGQFLYLYSVFQELDTQFNYHSAELWVMKEYGVTESWTKLHVYSYGLDFPRKWLIAFNPKEQAVLTTYRYSKPTWYALHDDSTTELDIPGIWDEYTNYCTAKPWVCVTTLASTTLFGTSTPASSPLHRSIT